MTGESRPQAYETFYLFYLYSLAQQNIVGGIADKNFIFTRIIAEIVAVGFVVRESFAVESDFETGGLSGLYHLFVVAFELLVGAKHFCVNGANVDLCDLFSVAFARVGHIEANAVERFSFGAFILDFETGEAERGVAFSETESEIRFYAFCIVMAVAHEEAFSV